VTRAWFLSCIAFLLLGPPDWFVESGGDSTAASGKATLRPTVAVRVDPRFELFSVICRLAGYPEYDQGLIEPYNRIVDEHFRSHAGHPVMELARTLRRQDGVSYDAVASLAVHVSDPPALAERVPLDARPQTLDHRWRPETARRFLELARDFAKGSDFAAFFSDQAPSWEPMVHATRHRLTREADLGWFDRYFGRRFEGKYVVSLALLAGPQCYAARIAPRGAPPELYCFLGVWSADERGRPAFHPEMIDAAVHEFAHAYVDPIVDAHTEALRSPGELMFRWVSSAMWDQAYGTWRLMIKESIVRACVTRYLRETVGAERAAAEIERDTERQFLWMDSLVQRLDAYEGGAEHETFAAFFPEVVAFFAEYAPAFDRERAARARRVPKIVKMTPANGSRDVALQTDRIVIVFDRDMDTTSWSVVGRGPHMPTLPKHVHYLDRRTFVIPVKLLPQWEYRFRLNSPRYHGFKSAEGVPLEPVTVTYRTQ